MPDFTTRTTRRRLPRSRSVRWARIARGRALGYWRSGEDAGTWYARTYTGEQPTPYRVGAIGTADDTTEADGKTVLTYGQGVERALAWTPNADAEAADNTKPATVADACQRYLAWFKAHRRSFDATRLTLEAHVLPELGSAELGKLTTEQIRAWHEALAAAPARLRSRAGDSRRRLRPATTDEQRRARRSTANRVLATFKAALNRAWEDGLVPTREAWQRVKPFRDADAARLSYLDSEDLRRLLNSCASDFRALVQAAVYTGARYGELAALRVADVRSEAAAVYVPRGKSGAPRVVYLGAEGLAFLEQLAAGRPPAAVLLTKANGKPWSKSEQTRPMAEACKAASLQPIGFHQLRHTYASLYVMSGGALVSLAKQLGHSTTRMVEKHYGHLSDAWRAEEARKHAPEVTSEARKVVRMRAAGRNRTAAPERNPHDARPATRRIGSAD